MSALLDTHTLLWALFEPEKLGSRVRDFLETSGEEIFTSTVNFFEISQKVRVGKLPLDPELVKQLPGVCHEQGWRNLALEPAHAISAGLYSSEHRDPFDRLLAAQAEIEGWVLLTKDQAFGGFPVRVFW